MPILESITDKFNANMRPKFHFNILDKISIHSLENTSFSHSSWPFFTKYNPIGKIEP